MSTSTDKITTLHWDDVRYFTSKVVNSRSVEEAIKYHDQLWIMICTATLDRSSAMDQYKENNMSTIFNRLPQPSSDFTVADSNTFTVGAPGSYQSTVGVTGTLVQGTAEIYAPCVPALLTASISPSMGHAGGNMTIGDYNSDGISGLRISGNGSWASSADTMVAQLNERVVRLEQQVESLKSAAITLKDTAGERSAVAGHIEQDPLLAYNHAMKVVV